MSYLTLLRPTIKGSLSGKSFTVASLNGTHLKIKITEIVLSIGIYSNFFGSLKVEIWHSCSA